MKLSLRFMIFRLAGLRATPCAQRCTTSQVYLPWYLASVACALIQRLGVCATKVTGLVWWIEGRRWRVNGQQKRPI